MIYDFWVYKFPFLDNFFKMLHLKLSKSHHILKASYKLFYVKIKVDKFTNVVVLISIWINLVTNSRLQNKHLFFLPNFPGPTFISCPTCSPKSRIYTFTFYPVHKWNRGWGEKKYTGPNFWIGIVQKVYEWSNCPFAKMIPPWEKVFGKRTAWSLIYFLNYDYSEIWPSVLCNILIVVDEWENEIFQLEPYLFLLNL